MSMLLALWTIVGALALVAWRGEKWFAQRAPSTTDTLEGEKYRYNEERSKLGLLINLLLRFEVPRERFFRLRRESWFDRFGKGIRLTVEPEAGEPVFDEMFFLDSDDKDMITLLMEKRELRSLLIMFNGLLLRQGARLKSMEAEDGKLTLHMRVFSVSEPERLREECVAWLKPLLQAIRDLPAPRGRPERQPNIMADKVRQLGLILFAFGGFSASWIICMSPDRLIDPGALVQFSTVLGVLIFLSLIPWAVRHLGRATNRHRALLLWLSLSLTGAVGCSFVLCRAVNIHLDFARSESILVDNAELLSSYRRKQGTTYEIRYRFEDWEPYRHEYLTIDGFEYRRLRKAWNGSNSGPAVLRIHPGLLGFQWREIHP